MASCSWNKMKTAQKHQAGAVLHILRIELLNGHYSDMMERILSP